MAQDRSANTYQKIDTIFKRDINNIIMPYHEWVSPEFEWLRHCKFDATEKIDGTNMRIEVEWSKDDAGVRRFNVVYKGKTDNANIPGHLLKFMQDTFPADKVRNALGVPEIITDEVMVEKGWATEAGDPIEDKIPMYTIYGEGYGVKIQKGGNYIKDGVGFIVFDVKVNNWWLLRPNVTEIADKLGAPMVPFMGQFTIDEAIEFVRKGFKSTIAENKDYDAEGLVLTTPNGLRNRKGERIIFKIKTCDFVKYRARYGTDEPVEQIDNVMYNRGE